MFQYALYRRMRLDGYPVILDDYRLRREGNQHNGLELVRDFALKDYRSIGAVTYYQCQAALFMDRLWRKMKFQGQYVINDVVTHFIPYSELISRNNRFLNGYWQSEDYFFSIADDIRNNYQFQNIDSKNQSLGDRMEQENSVSIHIRRGDYLSNPSIAYYQGSVCTLRYYRRAVQYILEGIRNCKFYVFSDDAEWVRQNFDFLNYELVDWNRGAESFKDMYLMSRCRHHIIANSTFSWWGAWLGNSPEKVIVAPEIWARDFECDHVLPQEWVKIAVDE